MYQAELTAIYYAIDWFVKTSFDKIIIFTDKSSTMAIQRNFPSNHIIRNIYRQLIQYPQKTEIIGWTRAHVGTPGNERADLLAKQAIIETDSDVKENIPHPVSLIKRIGKLNMIKDWQLSWIESKKGRDTYRIIKKVDDSFVCSGQLTQYFITSHGSFPEYLAKIGKNRIIYVFAEGLETLIIIFLADVLTCPFSSTSTIP